MLNLPIHPLADANCATCSGTGVHGHTKSDPERVERCDLCEVFPTDHHARAYACQATGMTSIKREYTVYVLSTEVHRETYEVTARSEEEARDKALDPNTKPDDSEFWEDIEKEVDEVDYDNGPPRFWAGQVLHMNGKDVLGIRDRTLPVKTMDGKDRFVLTVPYPKETDPEGRRAAKKLAKDIVFQLNAMSSAMIEGLVIAQ